MSAQPKTTYCDLCEMEPGEHHHPDIAIRFCTSCLDQFDRERRSHGRASYIGNGKLNGPPPKLTAFRLGALVSLFASERGRTKLERIAEAL